MTTFLQESAQLLLARPNVVFSGCLDQKIKKGGFCYWTKSYVIIIDGIIYIYENQYSKKPRSAGVLATFLNPDTYQRPKKSHPWIFVLKPIKDTIPLMKFSAPSKQDMLNFAENFKRGISNSNEIHPYKPVTEESLTSFYSSGNVESVYYEIPDELPPIPDDYIIAKMTTNDFMFRGNRDEASAELSKRFHVGSFLLRVDDEKHVLTVQLENSIVKYIVIRNTPNNTVSIQGDLNQFPNLTELVKYYHEHYIPNYKFKLTIPYKLVRKTK